MAITAAMVKELREMTGAGMMDCKKALTKTEGDMDAAVEFLRENGLAKAAKKAGRIAAEGIVATALTEDEKKAAEAAETENKDLFEEIKKDLNGKVKEVKVNPTLQEHPVTLSAEGGISMEMEKVLRRMPNAEGVESTKVLELNPNHTVFAALKAAHAAGDTDKVAKYAELLYDQALLIAGLPIEDPVAYAQLVCGLMQ